MHVCVCLLYNVWKGEISLFTVTQSKEGLKVTGLIRIQIKLILAIFAYGWQMGHLSQ